METEYECEECCDSGLTPDQSYCQACHFGKERARSDALSLSLLNLDMKTAIWIAVSATQKTERFIAAGKGAYLQARLRACEAERAKAEARAFELSSRLADLETQIEKLARAEAAERLRADQGWQRYESANSDRNAVRMEIAALKAAGGVPPGYALVPLVPTPEMLRAGWNNSDIAWKVGLPEYSVDDALEMAWDGMVAAAPAAPQVAEQTNQQEQK